MLSNGGIPVYKFIAIYLTNLLLLNVWDITVLGFVCLVGWLVGFVGVWGC